jgi:imidazole glycerol-phosphate synthase subunit HisF
LLRNRIIPCLLLYEGGLVKTKKYNLGKRKYVGDPINAVKIFNEKCVDEIVILDINASKSSSGPCYEILEEIASECFMPLAYGGGIVNVDQMSRLFSLGIEKVVLNNILLQEMDLLTQASEAYGSQSIVAAIDVKKNLFGQYRVFDSRKGRLTKLIVSEHIACCCSAGAGEIYLNFVDREGSFSGFDIAAINNFTDGVKVPVVVNGGAGKMSDIVDVFENTKINAVSAGSMFVFSGPHRAVLITYLNVDEIYNTSN